MSAEPESPTIDVEMLRAYLLDELPAGTLARVSANPSGFERARAASRCSLAARRSSALAIGENGATPASSEPT